jgi:hypothetical protein
MALRISNVAAIAACNSIVDLIDAGGTGTMQIRTGSPPTNVEDAASGVLLATLTFSATAFGAAADANPGATATAATITGDSSADATNTAGHFRVLSGGGTAIMHGTCGAGSGDMSFNSVAITSGSAVNVTSMTVTVPET